MSNIFLNIRKATVFIIIIITVIIIIIIRFTEESILRF